MRLNLQAPEKIPYSIYNLRADLILSACRHLPRRFIYRMQEKYSKPARHLVLERSKCRNLLQTFLGSLKLTLQKTA